jgi:O-antigen polymerase
MASQNRKQAAKQATLLHPERILLLQRALLVVCMIAYVKCFQWMYVEYLYPTWGYFGFDYDPPGTSHLALAWFLSVAPSLWMPMRLKRPSQLAYWVLYITVIIPSMFVPMYAGMNPVTGIAILMLTLFTGFAVAGSSYLLPLFRVGLPKIPKQIFWMVLAAVAISLTLWLLIVFRGHLQLVSFGVAYELRDAANDVAEGSLVNYAFMLLSGAINPFLMGYGLYFKRRWLFFAGALGQILIYSVGGTKGSILSIVFILIIYYILKIRKLPFAHILSFGSLLLLAGTTFSIRFTGNGDVSFFGGIVQFVILMRTLSINGLLTAQYFDFFQHNPLTYLSHIHGVNWFVHYPYNNPIGQEIGLAYAGTTDLDATAHFWATDGISGFGMPGILLISVVCAVVFWILDSVSKRHDPRLVALVTAYAAFNFANISIFTSLLSGGLALLIFFLYVLPKPGLKKSGDPANRKIRAASRLTEFHLGSAQVGE